MPAIRSTFVAAALALGLAGWLAGCQTAPTTEPVPMSMYYHPWSGEALGLLPTGSESANQATGTGEALVTMRGTSPGDGEEEDGSGSGIKGPVLDPPFPSPVKPTTLDPDKPPMPGPDKPITPRPISSKPEKPTTLPEPRKMAGSNSTAGTTLPCSMGGGGPGGPGIPREFRKMALPAYVIEPPDILLVESPPAKTLPDYQPIQGEHLVRPDGTISLGLYGSVRVAGLTLEQAKVAIEAQLATRIRKPEVNVDIYAYNSKVYYIIADGGGYGQGVTRLPFTGNETVLDAISQIGGLPSIASKKIWIARPTPDSKEIVLPVNWNAITREGIAATNYQVFPGDRIYIQSDCLIRVDSMIAKIVAPIERLFGVTLLGAGTISRLQNMGRGAQGGGF